MQTSTERKIAPETDIGRVRLAVSDLERSTEFYRETLGFEIRRKADGKAYLGAGGEELLVLEEKPGAQPRPKDTTGLYHYAILLPDRAALARSLRRLAQQDYPLWGASDHDVSEALYLDDPDGNGIELYRDRPRDVWSWREGHLQMSTLRLDVGALLAEAGGEPWDGLPAETTIGHMHLHVGDLEEAESFYHGVLGFDVTASYAGAVSFLSAGGYHHHLGVNVWAGVGAAPPSLESAGLVDFEVRLPDKAALDAVIERLQEAGTTFDRNDASASLTDPWGNGIVLTAANGRPAHEEAGGG